MKKKTSVQVGGYSANALVIPLAGIVAILHPLIILLVFEVNRSNNELSGLMQRCSDYQQYATNLQAGSSTLSETASAFVQIPVTQGGALNSGPLLRYAKELRRERRGPQISAWFQAQKVDSEIQSLIDSASEASEEMIPVQLHAIALVRSAAPPSSLLELTVIPEVPLTEDELAMTKQERIDYARSLILGQEYSMLKVSVSQPIERCHRTLKEQYTAASARCARHISAVRTGLWAVIFAIIVLLFCAFLFFYRWLIMPLRTYARQITSDQSMNQDSRVREMRLVVNAYNALLSRHNKLEAILRSAAETDALTELPNRYSLEHNLLEIGEDSGAMAVLLFDVNYLKRTNDTLGHQAGDLLLRTAGACIRECFEVEGSGSCYRIGGDEFAAVLRDCTEEEVKARINRFALALEREHISVSAGYAFLEKTDENSFRKLMKQADLQMYEQKKRVHERDRAGAESSVRVGVGSMARQSG